MKSLVFLLTLTLGACGIDASAPLTCAEPGTSHGVDLAIQDAKTGAAYPFYDIVAIATEGPFSDTLRVPTIADVASQRVFWLASDRPGTYTVTVHARGYATWTKTGVIVARKNCQIVPANLTVGLQPAT